MKKTPIVLASAFIMVLAIVLIIFIKAKLPEKHKIVVLNYSPAADHALDGFRKGMESHGYKEGRNLEIIYNGYIRDKQMLSQEAEKLLKLNPDLIYTMSTPATLIMKELTADSKIPIVFGPVSSPVEVGILDNLKSPPGGNITGVTFGPQESRRLEMMLKLRPDIKNVLISYNPNDKSPVAGGVDSISETAERLNLNLVKLEITSDDELKKTLYEFDQSFDAIYIPTDSMMVSYTSLIAEFAISKKSAVHLPPPA